MKKMRSVGRRRYGRKGWAAVVLGALCLLPARALPQVWRPFGPTGGSVNAVLVDPQRPATLYIAAGGVWKSEDQGATWRPISAGIEPYQLSAGLGDGITQLALDPADSRVLYAASGAGLGLYRSRDGGEHWQPVANGGSPAVAAEAGGSVAYAACYGVCRSRDGGDTWQQVLAGNSTDLESRILVDPKAPATVYTNVDGGLSKSTDGGTTWNRLEIPGLAPPLILSLALAPSAPQTLYASDIGGLWRSRDGGATWEGPMPALPSDCGLPYYGACQTLEVDPFDPRTLYTGSAMGLFVSHDGGETIVPAATGLPDFRRWGFRIGFSSAHAVAFGSRPGTVYLGSGKGLHRSEDGGESWHRLEVQGHYRNLVTNFRLDPHDRQGLLLRDQDEWRLSHDGGASFVSLADPRIADPYAAIEYDPWIRGRLWAVGERQLSVSRDGGAGWATVGPLPNAAGNGNAALTVVAPRVLLVGGQGIWQSQDAGATWRQRLAGTVTGIRRSQVWISRIVADPTSAAAFYAEGVLCLASGACRPHVYRSTDAGRHWRRWYVDRRGEGGIYVLPAARQPGHVRLLGARLGPVVATRDDGQSFARVSGEACGFCSILDAAVDRRQPDTLYAAEGYNSTGVERSLDGGASWESWSEGLVRADVLAETSEGSRILQDPFAPRRLYFVPLTGGVYRTLLP